MVVTMFVDDTKGSQAGTVRNSHLVRKSYLKLKRLLMPGRDACAGGAINREILLVYLLDLLWTGKAWRFWDKAETGEITM
jgi:hypothetical protein